MSPPVLVLDQATVERLLTPARAVAWVEEAYALYGRERAVTSHPALGVLVAAGEPPIPWGIKGAISTELGAAGIFFGAQWGDYHFALADARTGVLRALLAQSWITARRTAATGIAAAKRLGPPGARTVALIGAGRIGAEFARLAAACLPHETFRVASRTAEGARAFAATLSAETGRRIEPAASVAEAVRDADVVFTITLARAPMIGPGDIAPGALVCSMGGVEEVAFAALRDFNRLVVDEMDYALTRGDFAAWVRRGDIAREALIARLDADLGEVFAGSKPGRTAPEQRILAVIQGMAVCDLAIAHRLVAEARAQGLGSEVAMAPQRPRAAGEEPEAAGFVTEGLLAAKRRP